MGLKEGLQLKCSDSLTILPTKYTCHVISYILLPTNFIVIVSGQIAKYCPVIK